jgi:8-oxo-dGTP pyrophosphatase MutT (NUDIX family)
MISFKAGTHRFHLRAAALIVREGRVLLHRSERDDFWALPGGRVEPGETAQEAVVRELREELDVDVTATRLVWLVENFFAYRNEPHHEIGLYFAAEPSPGSVLATSPGPYNGVEGDARLIFEWFDAAAISALDVRPVFVKRALVAQDFEFRHVVHRDADH